MTSFEVIELLIAGISLFLSFVTLVVVMPMRSLRVKLEQYQEKALTEIRSEGQKAVADAKLSADKSVADAKSSAAAEAQLQLVKFAGELQKPIIELSTSMKSVEQRLLAGHEHMRRLDEKDHVIEKSVLKELSEVRELMAQQPTKDDLNRMRDELREEMKRHG